MMVITCYCSGNVPYVVARINNDVANLCGVDNEPVWGWRRHCREYLPCRPRSDRRDVAGWRRLERLEHKPISTIFFLFVWICLDPSLCVKSLGILTLTVPSSHDLPKYMNEKKTTATSMIPIHRAGLTQSSHSRSSSISSSSSSTQLVVKHISLPFST